MKIYKTFDEIDRDLKVLRLQAKIEREELKIGISRLKEDVSPISMAANFVGSLTKKAFLLKAISSFVGWRRKK